MLNGDIVQIKWLKKALNELDSEMEYLAKQDIDIAIKVYTCVRETVNTLKNFPNKGRKGEVLGTRELIMPNYSYLIPYRIKNKSIEILRFFHTSRKPPRKW